MQGGASGTVRIVAAVYVLELSLQGRNPNLIVPTVKLGMQKELNIGPSIYHRTLILQMIKNEQEAKKAKKKRELPLVSLCPISISTFKC